MTIDEAVEKYRNRVVISDREQHTPADVLAQAYLYLADPTALTVELIEAELGASGVKFIYMPSHFRDGIVCWRIGQWTDLLSSEDGQMPVRLNSSPFWIHTLGHLRQIVAMLRGGGA